MNVWVNTFIWFSYDFTCFHHSKLSKTRVAIFFWGMIPIVPDRSNRAGNQLLIIRAPMGTGKNYIQFYTQFLVSSIFNIHNVTYTILCTQYCIYTHTVQPWWKTKNTPPIPGSSFQARRPSQWHRRSATSAGTWKNSSMTTRVLHLWRTPDFFFTFGGIWVCLIWIAQREHGFSFQPVYGIHASIFNFDQRTWHAKVIIKVIS